MVDPKHPSNKNRPHHHPSLFESHIKEDSKPRNPPPPSRHPPHHPPPPAEKSQKTREKEKGNILPANKERSKETSTELSTTWRRSGTGGWKNSPKTKTNPTNTTTKPSETSTKNHMDSKILMEISERKRRVMLRFHFPMLTILGHTLLFYTNPTFSLWTLDIIMTSHWHHYDVIPHLWHHYSTLTSLWLHSYIITPLWHHRQNTINTRRYHSCRLTCSYLVTW